MERIGPGSVVQKQSQDEFTAEDLVWLSRLNPHTRCSEHFLLPAQTYDIDMQSEELEIVNFKFQSGDRKLAENVKTTFNENEKSKQKKQMNQQDAQSLNYQQKSYQNSENENFQEQYSQQQSPNHISEKQIEQQEEFLELKKKFTQKYFERQTNLEPTTHKISTTKRNIKRTIPSYGHKKINQKAEKLKKQFKSCIKIISERLNEEKETEYLWKLGTVKVWHTIDQALKKNFQIYNRQVKKYKNTIKKHLPNYSALSVVPKKQSSKLKFNPGQTLNVKKQKFVIEQFEQNEKYMVGLKELFDDVITTKYIIFQKTKSQKSRFNLSKDYEFQFCQEDSQQQSSHHTEYIPEANEVQLMLANIIELSNEKFQKKFKCRKIQHPKTERNIMTEKNMGENERNIKLQKSYKSQNRKTNIATKQPENKKVTYPIDASIIDELQKFQQSYNYSKQIDNMLGHLNKRSQKLSCSNVVGRRSKNRVIDVEEINEQSFYVMPNNKFSETTVSSRTRRNGSQKYEVID